MKAFLFISLWLAASFTTKAQTFSKNFEKGVPKDWVIQNSNGANWEPKDSFGVNQSSCMWVDMSHSVSEGTFFLQTPLIDLEKLDEPYLQFQVALVNKNFIIPRLVLAYSSNGNWEKLLTWGDGVTDSFITAQNTLEISLFDNSVRYYEITWPLDSLKKHKKIRFSFNAVFVNGGWVLLDDVVIKDRKSIGFELPIEPFEIYPNPVAQLLNIELNTGQNVRRLQITDSQGKILLEPTIHSHERVYLFNTSQFPAGVYFAHLVFDSGEVITKKFLKSETF